MKKDKLVVIITIGIVCFLLASVIFMQFKVTKETRETNIDTMQEAELRQQLANWKTQYDDIKQKNVVDIVKEFHKFICKYFEYILYDCLFLQYAI